MKNRLEMHNSGNLVLTKNRRPLKLIYYAACLNQEDALKIERYLPCEIILFEIY